MKSGILAGKTVVELGSMIAAPFATHLLNQLGADVIKIEPPAGETTRKLVRGGPSGSYIAFNRGKRSLCLDMAADEGQAAFRKLIASTDIVVQNLSPSAARKLGATFEVCNAINPDIIFCHIKGYGAGPLEERVASNPIAEAATGVMYYNRPDGRPARLGPSYHDQFAGCYAAIAVLSALMSDRSQDKRDIEIGLYETGLHIAARDLLGVQLKTQLLGRPEQEPSAEFSIPGYGAYETRDGRWIYLVMLTDEHWRKFCAATGLTVDPELAALRQRRARRPDVEALVTAAVADVDFDDLVAKLDANGVGHTEVLPLDRVLEAPQAKSGEKVSDFGFAGYDFQAPELPLGPLLGPVAESLPPPYLGEHTAQILQDLGYTESQVSDIVGHGAAVVSDPDAQLWAKPRDRATVG
ncbi:Crotonobetainyl-CoA:carnitine CoA-transferase CaiB [Roseovarius pacificus]|uniref:Crotonobetainyl-CoA:carnitine CoA-transferase CaiB n=1 Tax=Roseovarius pacificus TaxID=337701 RepID=A0A1M7AE61_9RHOB|nr:CaiB/BaiF CoA-transferase family protein [Roseovarius pacificus]GGO53579.1 CoA transferase [Roseovarius pacificus]SHL40819.1 Crotonobetainyl-CoA:carnitine CoA-transferase CaiB [Roseovarius pacificus]